MRIYYFSISLLLFSISSVSLYSEDMASTQSSSLKDSELFSLISDEIIADSDSVDMVTTPFGSVDSQPVDPNCLAKKQAPPPPPPEQFTTILPPVDLEETTCPPDLENEGYVLNFQDIDFVEYLNFLSKLTNTNFVYNTEDVQFTVSIVADEPTSIKDVRASLMQILRIQGLTLLEEGNNVIISKDPALKAVASVVSEEMQNVCDDSTTFVTRVFYLKNVDADKMATIISSMVSKDAIVESSVETHHLIVTDLNSNVQRIGDLLKSLDNPQAAFEIGTYKVQKTYIENLISLGEKILFPISEGNPLVMVPQARSNTIFVVSTPYLVQKSLEVLQALDVGQNYGKEQQDPAPEGHMANSEFFIYKLQYHKGNTIRQTLTEVGQDLSGFGKMNQELLMTINSAQWIESTNSLLFVGNEQVLGKIKQLLEILDAPLRQVFIEVLAVRTTMGNSLELGVQYGYRGKANGRLAGSGGLLTTANQTLAGRAVKPNIFTQGLDAASGPALPVPQTPSQLGFAGGVIGNVLNAKGNLYFDLATLVSALQSDSQTEVMTNPKLVTQDTIPATFYVGSTRPFQTNSILQASGSSSGNFVTASIEYRQLGLSLTVTPYLGSGDMITLEIDQSTSDYVSNAVSGNGGSSDNFAIVPVTNDSSITTRVHIPNKHFLMISGMLEDVKTRNKTAIPCLGGIPVIGDLLGVKANSISKDNFIIFLRPQIIDTDEELDSITEREDQLFRSKSKQGSFIKNSAILYDMNK